jgi:hypothetical protein
MRCCLHDVSQLDAEFNIWQTIKAYWTVEMRSKLQQITKAETDRLARIATCCTCSAARLAIKEASPTPTLQLYRVRCTCAWNQEPYEAVLTITTHRLLLAESVDADG